MKKKIKQIKPIHETRSDYEELEEILKKYFRDEIFAPLVRELLVKPRTILNAKTNSLLEAIKENKIRFADGRFTGKFSASISKKLIELGAKWDRKTGSFKILKSDLPVNVRAELSVAQATFESTMGKIATKLDSLSPAKFNAEKFFDKAIFKTNVRLKKSMQNIAVLPELTPEQTINISKLYTDNLEKYVKDFTDKEINELRQSIQVNMMKGARYEDMIKVIQDRYQVSKNKAKFLARQETALMQTTLKKVRYTDAGVQKYIWKTVVGSSKHPVRPDHKKLDGKVFEYDKPPITDSKGNRNNPGQDYNCRCYDVPIIEF